MALVFPSLLLGSAGVVLFYLFTWVSRQAAARRHGCKAPPRKPTFDPILGIGYRVETFKSFESGTGLLEYHDWHKQLGMTYTESTLLGSSIKTAEVENFRAIFGTHGRIWGIKPFRYEGFKPFCGEGLASTDGPEWERARNILKPFFHLSKISDLSFFEGLVQGLLERIPGDGSTTNFEPVISNLFLDNACRIILGEPVGIFGRAPATELPMTGNAFAEAWHRSLLGCGMRMFFGRLSFLIPSSMTYQQWAKVHEFFDFYVDKAIKAKASGDPFSQQHSVINATLDVTDDRYEIRKQALHAMLAAQDTIPVLINNTIWELARHPDIWLQLRQEVAAISPDSLTIEEARKPRLLRNILSEILRLYPVFPVFARDATADTVLPTGGGPNGKDPIFCPTGTNVVADFWTFNRDLNGVFGADAEKFKPERWDDLRLEAWDNMTFGNGLRTCLGRHKALGEASCLMIRLAQTFTTLESRDDKPYAGVLQLVGRNKNGCHVAFRK